MQRLVGYLFFLALAGAAIVSLIDRYRGTGTVEPFERKPDWLGIGLLVFAILCAAAVLLGRRKGRASNGREPDRT